MLLKAQAQELIEASLIALSIFLLIIVFTYQYGEKTSTISSTMEKYILEKTAFSNILTLYNSQLPAVKKFVLETIIDSILQKEFISTFINNIEETKVFYGTEIGKVNTSEVLIPLMNEYFGNRWKIIIETPSNEIIEYGNPWIGGRKIYAFSLPVPFPGLRTGNITLILGEYKNT